jgi:bacillithiol biosynthesis cysteine-adding enzyme BshC
LYTVSKAAAAIVDARALSEESGLPCVPVFWLQNEDHDFAEIAHTSFLDGEGRLQRVSLPEAPERNGTSIRAHRLGPAVEQALDTLGAALEPLRDSAGVMALLRDCYRPERSPDGAFVQLMDRLFADHGLLVLDPSDPELADAAAPVHQRAIHEADTLAGLLQERSQTLADRGFHVQVYVRPDAPLSFFHPDGPHAPRFRIEPDGPAHYRLLGSERRISSDELLRAPPGHFSTSALLRPLLQDHWLPTAAYVGGPGEIAYLAQLPPLYQHLGLPMPLVVPRARLRILDETSERLLDQLGLDADDLDLDRQTLLGRMTTPAEQAGELLAPEALQAALLDPVLPVLRRFRGEAGQLDKGLGKAVDKTEGSIVDLVGRLTDRYRRTLAGKDEVRLGRMQRLLDRLHPNDGPQERTLGWPLFGARLGVDSFVDSVIAAILPFDGGLHELRS